MSRLELLSETLRLFCKCAKDFSSQMDQFLFDQMRKYSEKLSSYKMPQEDKVIEIKNIGKAMRAFIVWVESSKDRSKLSEKEAFKTLNADEVFLVRCEYKEISFIL